MSDEFEGFEFSEKWGGYALLQELRDIMRRWEQLPASGHQTAAIQRLSEAAHGIQELQRTDYYFWPVRLPQAGGP